MEYPVHLARNINGVHFPHPLMVAGGIVKTAEQVLARVNTDDIPEWGSITTPGGAGNGGRDYHAEYFVAQSGERVLLYTQNSLGLPNPGMKYVEKHAPDLIKRYADVGKPLAINVSGEGATDLAELVERAFDCGFSVITANAACPNKIDRLLRPTPILCYDEESMMNFVRAIERKLGGTLPSGRALFLKVSTGMPRTVLEFNRSLVAQHVFSGIITGNTVPNSFMYGEDTMTTIFTSNQINRGGMAGPAIKPLALDHTKYCADLMPKGKIVIGSGGVGNVQDVRKYVWAGATLIQYNSAYREANENPQFTTDLLVEL